MRILGIDPGFGRVGYGVVEERRGSWVHVAHGCIETSPKRSFVDRLVDIHKELQTVIAAYAPTDAAVEELFFYKNVTTAIQVGQARGVILLTLHDAGVPIVECTPLQVKQAITGYGKAEKHQVATMIRLLLGLPKSERIIDDATDALAIAIAGGHFRPKSPRSRPR